MNHPPSLAPLRTVSSGHTLVLAGESAPIWRVKSGVFFLRRPCLDGHLGVQLALPGDLVGLETMAQQVHAFTAVALRDASVQAEQFCDSACLHTALLEALQQQQRQMLDVVQLRSGPIAQRLKHLLTLLARTPEGGFKTLQREDLPTLRDMAQIVDSALETVCRELNVLLPRERAAPKHTKPRAATRWVPTVHFPMGLAA